MWKYFVYMTYAWLPSYIPTCVCMVSCNHCQITRAKYNHLPRSIYVQRVETVKQWGPWNSLGIITCRGWRPWNRHVKPGSLVVMWWLWKTQTSKSNLTLKIWSKFGDRSLNALWIFRLNLTLKVVINLQIDRDLNEGVLHFWSKFLAWTDLELLRGQTGNWHTDRQKHTHTHRRSQWLYPKEKAGVG